MKRNPDGFINNCALANGDEQKNCQVCKGTCPDGPMLVEKGIIWDHQLARHKPGMRKRSEVRAAKKASDRSDESRPEIPPPAESKPTPKRSKDNPYDFPNANKARMVRPPAELQRIVENVFVRELFKEWKELEGSLDIGEKRSEHGYAKEALDKAAGRAYRAHRLYLTARNMLDAWELENEVIFGAMWSEATRSIQKEKEDGIRRKAITNDDIRRRVATMFPDEYQAQEKKRRELKAAVESLERLAEIWVGKQRDAAAIVGKNRG